MANVFFLILATYAHYYQKLNSSPYHIFVILVQDAFHFQWHHCHMQACTDYTWRQAELENKSLSKEMDIWIIFRLKVVSFITNSDSSWQTFPNSTRLNFTLHNSYSCTDLCCRRKCMQVVCWISVYTLFTTVTGQLGPWSTRPVDTIILNVCRESRK